MYMKTPNYRHIFRKWKVSNTLSYMLLMAAHVSLWQVPLCGRQRSDSNTKGSTKKRGFICWNMKLSNYKLGAISYKQLIINNQNMAQKEAHSKQGRHNHEQRVRTWTRGSRWEHRRNKSTHKEKGEAKQCTTKIKQETQNRDWATETTTSRTRPNKQVTKNQKYTRRSSKAHGS